MAENKILEREYTIPLRKEFLKVPRYRRMQRAIKTIKQFIAKHMKIPDREVSKVKLDMYLNNELWFRGIKNPPTKIKVKATREKDLVKVDFIDIPDFVTLKIKAYDNGSPMEPFSFEVDIK